MELQKLVEKEIPIEKEKSNGVGWSDSFSKLNGAVQLLLTLPKQAISVPGEEMTSPRAGLGGWARRKIVDPIKLILKKGAEPKQLALSTALGLTLGVFPICGVTVLLCGIAVALLGSTVHAPSLMLANFIATPIELSLVLPFLRIGEVITGGDHLPLTSDALKKVITGQASYEVLLGVMHALIGWLVTAPFILVVLYILFIPCFKFAVHKFSHHIPSPKKTHHPHPEVKVKARNV